MLENAELLVGDCLCLICFALYKQVRWQRQAQRQVAGGGCRGARVPCICIALAPHPCSDARPRLASLYFTFAVPRNRPQITALIFLPSFPGWLVPRAFNPTRFLEFFSFGATLLGTWVAAGAQPWEQ